MPDDTTPDPVAARLAEIRERAREPKLRMRDVDASAADVPALLNAVEGVLELHRPGPFLLMGSLCAAHKVHRHFSITTAEAAGVAACGDCMATVSTTCTGCGTGASFDRCPHRKAISAALLGEQP